MGVQWREASKVTAIIFFFFPFEQHRNFFPLRFSLFFVGGEWKPRSWELFFGYSGYCVAGESFPRMQRFLAKNNNSREKFLIRVG